MDTLRDPEQVGYGLAVAIVTFGGAGLVALFYVSLTIGKYRGRGLSRLATRWLRNTSILFAIAFAGTTIVATYR